MKNIAIVIAHYHPTGKVADHLLNLIEIFSKTTKNIVFASTNINESCESNVNKNCELLKVENIGYDFWSYKNGIDFISKKNLNLDKLIIINSSILNLQPQKLADAILKEDGFIGIKALTISEEHAIHAQSFCLSFEGNEFIKSNDFKEWWGNLTPIANRQEVIDKYEIGMSQFFLKKGYKIKQLFNATDHDKLIALSRAISTKYFNIELNTKDSQVILDLNWTKHLNPTHFYWDILIDQFGFIKIELVKNNSTNQNLQHFLNNLRDNHYEYYRLLEDSLL